MGRLKSFDAEGAVRVFGKSWESRGKELKRISSDREQWYIDVVMKIIVIIDTNMGGEFETLVIKTQSGFYASLTKSEG